MSQLSLFQQAAVPGDVVLTEQWIAKQIISHFQPEGVLLDPCRGEGAFFDVFPKNAAVHFCEIKEGKDFFAHWGKADWIIGNPPYSPKIFLPFLEHSFALAENVVYVLPTNKVFQSWKVIDLIEKYGGIKTIIAYGSGHSIGFPFGFSVGTFHFKREYKGSLDLFFRKPPASLRFNLQKKGGDSNGRSKSKRLDQSPKRRLERGE